MQTKTNKQTKNKNKNYPGQNAKNPNCGLQAAEIQLACWAACCYWHHSCAEEVVAGPHIAQTLPLL